jgi:hypothetical protein
MGSGERVAAIDNVPTTIRMNLVLETAGIRRFSPPSRMFGQVNFVSFFNQPILEGIVANLLAAWPIDRFL